MHVTYAPLPAVTDVDKAMSDEAPRLHDGWPDNLASRREILAGDPDRMFAAAHTIVDATFTMPRQAAAPLEGRAACASYDRERDELTVWVSSQAPHQWRTVIAATLGMEENRIVVIVPDVGGGFGVKLHYYPETDSLYIELSGNTSADSREVVDGVVVDLDADGSVVGIDIDQASKKLDLDTIETVSLPLSPR